MFRVKLVSTLPALFSAIHLYLPPSLSFDPMMLMVESVLSWCSLDSLTTATPPPSSLELFAISLPSNCQEMAAAGIELILQTRLALEPILASTYLGPGSSSGAQANLLSGMSANLWPASRAGAWHLGVSTMGRLALTSQSRRGRRPQSHPQGLPCRVRLCRPAM